MDNNKTHWNGTRKNGSKGPTQMKGDEDLRFGVRDTVVANGVKGERIE